MKQNVVTVLGCLAALTMCARRHGEIVEVPFGYKGWVEIIYSASCTPARATADGHRVLSIAANGRLCTGSPWEEGTASDEFFYVDGAHLYPLHEETPHTGRIWGRSTVQHDRRKELVERFFVGTEPEYRRETLMK